MKLVSIRKQLLTSQDGALVHFKGNYFPQHKDDELFASRTHLIRADNIMFSDLLEIAQIFFQSKTMVKEWIDSQFQFRSVGTEPDN